MKKILLRCALILIILAVIVLYAYDIIVIHTDPTEHLFRFCCVVLLSVVALIRTFQVGHRNSLEFYDRQYAEILNDVMCDQPFWRNKLLCAVRLYNESSYEKALKYLTDLKQKVSTNKDHYAIDLFAALCFTDMELYDHAIKIYQRMISTGNANSRIFSNLGHVQMRVGKHKAALYNYEIALQYDHNNEFAYNNIAQAHFQMHEFEDAISFAKKALEINPKMPQSSSLLAIIYTLLSDQENSEKYFHIAINCGVSPNELKESIEYFRTAQHTMDDPIKEDN